MTTIKQELDELVAKPNNSYMGSEIKNEPNEPISEFEAKNTSQPQILPTPLETSFITIEEQPSSSTLSSGYTGHYDGFIKEEPPDSIDDERPNEFSHGLRLNLDQMFKNESDDGTEIEEYNERTSILPQRIKFLHYKRRALETEMERAQRQHYKRRALMSEAEREKHRLWRRNRYFRDKLKMTPEEAEVHRAKMRLYNRSRYAQM
uniref:Uncharacterized protein n=1 Tax=Acrobeloides nanus TaxID=290746 RepID=A0A914D2K8_9BILA